MIIKGEKQMQKEDIIFKVNEMMTSNKQLDKAFQPLIEEFFIRLVKNFNFDETQLDTKIKRLSKTENIGFAKLEEYVQGINSQDFEMDFNNKIVSLHNSIYFSIENLKDILNYNIDYYLIEHFFHELGHACQLKIENSSIKNGLQTTDLLNNETTGIMTNEIAEVLNSRYLRYGYNRDTTVSYSFMVDIVNSFYRSLGFSTKEIANLQWQENAREQFENTIKERVGEDYKGYIDATEKKLDAIYYITKKLRTINDKKEKDNLQKNLQTQIRGFNILTNCIIQKRAINSRGDLYSLLQIDLDKEYRNILLERTLKSTFEKNIQENSININEGYNRKILENQIGAENNEKFLNLRKRIGKIDSSIFESLMDEHNNLEKKFVEELLEKQENIKIASNKDFDECRTEILEDFYMKSGNNYEDFDDSNLDEKFLFMAKKINLKKYPLNKKIELHISKIKHKIIGMISDFKIELYKRGILKEPELPLLPEDDTLEEMENDNIEEFINTEKKINTFKESLISQNYSQENKKLTDKIYDKIQKGREEDENVR